MQGGSGSRWPQIAAQYLALELETVREAAFEAHGLRPSEVFTDVELARAFTDSMPAADVWITLRTAKHRNRSSVWKPNDIFDIDALAVAAAYCDVVVIERPSAVRGSAVTLVAASTLDNAPYVNW